MKVLVVTGKLAQDSVERYISEEDSVDVLSLPVSVAAFITPDSAAKMLLDLKIKNYDLILMPGSVQGDVSPVRIATGIPTFKGPLHASDLPLVLHQLGKIKLSTRVPASELVKDILKSQTMFEINKVDRNWRETLKLHGGLVIGKRDNKVPVGRAFPMRVIAEIVNAPLFDMKTIKERAHYYKKEGADIIDIGMLAGRPMPQKIQPLVEAVKSSVDLPISIDTLEPSEIFAAVDAGVDLVLSVDTGNMEDVASSVSEIPVVVLPSNMKEGRLPRKAEKRVSTLIDNLEKARSLGLEKLIADPILEPVLQPGIMESLRAYYLYRKFDNKTPVLFGLGNVTELIDVDSPGVNGILTALACEVGADLLFIPEFSPKTRGSVREVVTASKMMFVSMQKGKIPKDLGFNLLSLKEKLWREDPYDEELEKNVKKINAERNKFFEQDPVGWFKIAIDRKRNLIAAIHFPINKKNSDSIVKGRSATMVYQTLVRRGLVSRLEHAAYLGKELEKAEIALRLGRSYVQDEELFS